MTRLPFGIQDPVKEALSDEPSVMDRIVLICITVGTVTCLALGFAHKFGWL